MKTITTLIFCFAATLLHAHFNTSNFSSGTSGRSRTIISGHTVGYGIVSAHQTICEGLSPHNITLSGVAGQIQWQSSFNKTDWSNIPNAKATTLTAAQMGNLLQTTYYRALIESDMYTSNTVQVTVLQTGCTDPEACNFNKSAQCDDDSCHYLDACGICGGWATAGCISDGSCTCACVLPVINYIVTPCNDRGFTVWIDVLNLGTAGPYVISNNQNNETFEVDATGGWMTSSFLPNATVQFTCTSVHSANCNAESEIIGCTLHTEEVDFQQMEVFPNPANHGFTLLLPSDRQVEIIIIDLQGKQVYQTTARGARFEIDTQRFANGTYVLRVSDSLTSRTRRLVIHH
jgi:hypothetical protein